MYHSDINKCFKVLQFVCSEFTFRSILFPSTKRAWNQRILSLISLGNTHALDAVRWHGFNPGKSPFLVLRNLEQEARPVAHKYRDIQPVIIRILNGAKPFSVLSSPNELLWATRSVALRIHFPFNAHNTTSSTSSYYPECADDRQQDSLGENCPGKALASDGFVPPEKSMLLLNGNNNPAGARQRVVDFPPVLVIMTELILKLGDVSPHTNTDPGHPDQNVNARMG